MTLVRSSEFQSSRVQSWQVPEFQSFKVAEFQSFKVPEFENSSVPGLEWEHGGLKRALDCDIVRMERLIFIFRDLKSDYLKSYFCFRL